MNEVLEREYTGFAEGNQEMLESLYKALEAGAGVDPALFTGAGMAGRAMTPESLDTTLVNVLWSQDEAKLFKALKKQAVKSPVHQWAKRTGVGNTDGAWVAEGGDSQEADQSISRKYVTMKYLQTLRKVTLQATVTNMLEDAIASEKMAGTLWIIQQIEKVLFEGDSAVVEEEPDGLIKLITGTDNIIDVRGKDASSVEFENAITQGCRVIRAKYGIATDLYSSLKVMEDVQRLLRDRIRFPAGVTEASSIFTKYPTPFGKPELIDDIFILEGDEGVASLLTTDRPSQPTIASATAAASGGLESKFFANDVGSYYYQVAHVNEYGLSQLSAEVQCAAVAADEKVTITITDGATPGTGVFLFRGKKDAAASQPKLFFVKAAYDGPDQEVIDLNHDLPGTSSAFLLNLNPMYDAMRWLQFLPMMKFDLYPTNAAVIPFLMLLFGALGLKKEEQTVRIKNIQPSGLGWY